MKTKNKASKSVERKTIKKIKKTRKSVRIALLKSKKDSFEKSRKLRHFHYKMFKELDKSIKILEKEMLHLIDEL